MTPERARKVLESMLGRTSMLRGTSSYDQGIHVLEDIPEQREAIEFALRCIRYWEDT